MRRLIFFVIAYLLIGGVSLILPAEPKGYTPAPFDSGKLPGASGIFNKLYVSDTSFFKGAVVCSNTVETKGWTDINQGRIDTIAGVTRYAVSYDYGAYEGYVKIFCNDSGNLEIAGANYEDLFTYRRGNIDITGNRFKVQVGGWWNQGMDKPGWIDLIAGFPDTTKVWIGVGKMTVNNDVELGENLTVADTTFSTVFQVGKGIGDHWQLDYTGLKGNKTNPKAYYATQGMKINKSPDNDSCKITATDSTVDFWAVNPFKFWNDVKLDNKLYVKDTTFHGGAVIDSENHVVLGDLMVGGDVKPQMIRIQILYDVNLNIPFNSNANAYFGLTGQNYDTLCVDSIVGCCYTQADTNTVDSVCVVLYSTLESLPYLLSWGDGTDKNPGVQGITRMSWTGVNFKMCTTDRFYYRVDGKQMAATNDIGFRNIMIFGHPQ